MELAIITDEVSQDLDVALQFACDVGIRRAALRSAWSKNVLDFDAVDLRRAATCLDRYKVSAVSVLSPLFKCAAPSADTVALPDDPNFTGSSASFPMLRRKSMRLWDVASSLNARYVRVFSFLRNQAAPAPSEESRDWLEWLRAVARDRDVTVGVENEHSCAVGTFPELHDMASRLSPLFPLVLDPCNHWQLSNDDGRVDLKGRRSLIEHAIDVHVKDVDADGAYTTIGDGVIAWDDILGVLEDRSYTGLVTLEPHLRGDRTRLRKSVEVVRAWLG